MLPMLERGSKVNQVRSLFTAEKRFPIWASVVLIVFFCSALTVLAGAVGGPKRFELVFEDRRGGFGEGKLVHIEVEGGKEFDVVVTAPVCGSASIKSHDGKTLYAGYMKRLPNNPKICAGRGTWTPHITTTYSLYLMNDSKEPSTYVIQTN